MKRLNKLEAQALLEQAYESLVEHPSQRFGQALYNVLPKDIAAEINGTQDDFFYETDNVKVLDIFINGCCEVGVEL